MSEGRGPDRFDRALERALREMLDVEPPAGLRARVLRRIARADASPVAAAGFRRWLLVFGAPLAAAALLVLAILLPRRDEPRAATNTPTATARVETPASRVAEPPRTSPSRTPDVKRPRTPRVVTARTNRAIPTYAYVPGAPVDTNIEPLTTITPIEVAPVRQRSLTTEDIAMHPLNPIADLSIAPLDPPQRRN